MKGLHSCSVAKTESFWPTYTLIRRWSFFITAPVCWNRFTFAPRP